jgi:hypothetical protein
VIESFRAALILYTNQARNAVEEASSEVLRTKLWLENDLWRLLENELRIRAKKMEQAQQELFTARLSNFQEPTALLQMALHRAQRDVRETEEKLVRLKTWHREIENRSNPLVKQVEQLHYLLSVEMPKAVASLAQVVKTLDAYVGVALPGNQPATGEGA